MWSYLLSSIVKSIPIFANPVALTWFDLGYTINFVLIVCLVVRACFIYKANPNDFSWTSFCAKIQWVRYVILPIIAVILVELVSSAASSGDSPWIDLHYRLKIIEELCVLVIVALIVFTNPKQLWDEVYAEIHKGKDMALPLAIVAGINILEARTHPREFQYQFAVFVLEFVIVVTTYLAMIAYGLIKLEFELKNDAGFWRDLSDGLGTLNGSLIGWQTTELKRMFEPVGLKYFQLTAMASKKAKVTNQSFQFHRIFVIPDCEEKDPINTWATNAKRKENQLTRIEQFFKVYILLHKDNDIELHFVTQRHLHTLLNDLRGKLTNDPDRTELEQICPSDADCKGLQLEELDCLMINDVFYNTAPSYTKGLKFTANQARSSIVKAVSQKIIDDPKSSVEEFDKIT